MNASPTHDPQSRLQHALEAYEKFGGTNSNDEVPSQRFLRHCQNLRRLIQCRNFLRAVLLVSPVAPADAADTINGETDASFRGLRYLIARHVPPALQLLMSNDADELRCSVLDISMSDELETSTARAQKMLDEFETNRGAYVLDPAATDGPPRDQYDAVRALELTPNERIFVDEICEKKGRHSLANLRLTFQWDRNSDSGWNSMQSRLNQKLKSIGWVVNTKGYTVYLKRLQTA